MIYDGMSDKKCEFEFAYGLGFVGASWVCKRVCAHIETEK